MLLEGEGEPQLVPVRRVHIITSRYPFTGVSFTQHQEGFTIVLQRLYEYNKSLEVIEHLRESIEDYRCLVLPLKEYHHIALLPLKRYRPVASPPNFQRTFCSAVVSSVCRI